MMRTEFPEEATTLLEEQEVPFSEDGKRVPDKKAKKKRMLRTVIAAVVAVGVFVGSVAAVDVSVMRQQAQLRAERASHADEVGYGLTTDLEARSFSSTWCAFHSAVERNTYCYLTSDPEQCRRDATAACEDDDSAADGSGSGSGSGSW